MATLGYPRLRVGGTLVPDVSGALFDVLTPANYVYPGGVQYSSSRDSTPISAGLWTEMHQAYLVTPASTTVAALSPTGAAVSSNSSSVASKISINNQSLTAPVTYWLYFNSGSPKWVLLGEGTLTDRGGDVIASGSIIFPIRFPGIGFVGGLGATWQASPSAVWFWQLQGFTDGTTSGFFTGLGTTPQTAPWSIYGSSTGTPRISNGPFMPAAI